MIFRIGQGRHCGDPQAFGQGSPVPPGRKCVCGVAENKETGGSPFAPCEIRRSTKSKDRQLPTGLTHSLPTGISDRSAYISMVALVGPNCSPRLGPQDPVNSATIIASASEPPLQFSDP